MSQRGNTDETQYSPDAQKARSLARAARNADLDSVHEYPAPTLTIFSDNEHHSVIARSLPETEADREFAERLLIARATRTKNGAAKPAYVPPRVYDKDLNPGGVMTFEQREAAVISCYRARSREDLTAEKILKEHGVLGYVGLLIVTAAEDAPVTV